MTAHKNAFLAKKLGVAPSTVTLWIQNSLEGKNNLQLEESKGKYRIIDNAHNAAEMQRLKEANRKYISDQWFQEVEPQPQFYQIFSEQQIIEIIYTLNTMKEIPLKFTYLDKGAHYLDELYTRGVKEGTYPTTYEHKKLLEDTFDFLASKLDKNKKINIIDVGPGNGLPIRDLLKKVVDKKLINKYIAVDISPEINNIIASNLSVWLPELEVKTYICDIEKNDIAKILFENKNQDVINVIFFVGGIFGNVTDREKLLKNFRDSLDEEDLIVIVDKVDTFVPTKVKFNHLLPLNELFIWLPRILNINIDDCELVVRYDEEKDSKIFVIKLDKDYTITFRLLDKIRVVNLKKGEEIIIFRHHLSKLTELLGYLNNTSLRLIQLTTDDFSNFLTICEVWTKEKALKVQN